MGGQAFFINHTRKEIRRTDNDPEYNISENLQIELNNGWKITDWVELIWAEEVELDYTERLLLKGYILAEWEYLDWLVSDMGRFWRRLATKAAKNKEFQMKLNTYYQEHLADMEGEYELLDGEDGEDGEDGGEDESDEDK